MKALVLLFALISYTTVFSQSIDEYFLQLPKLLSDNYFKSRQEVYELPSYISSTNNITYSYTVDSVMNINIHLYVSADSALYFFITETTISEQCDNYNTVLYKYQNFEWKECSMEKLPFIYCFLYFDENVSSVPPRICYDQNVSWEYSIQPSGTIEVQPIAFKDELCFDSFITNPENWDTKEQYNTEIKKYYDNINNRKHKKIILQWNPTTTMFENTGFNDR